MPNKFQMGNAALQAKGRVVDRYLAALFAFFSLFRRTRTNESLLTYNPRRILIFESHLIGDVVMLSPLLDSLVNRYPSAEITVLGNAWAKDIVALHPHVKNVVTANIPWARYDYSVRNLWRLFLTVLSLRKKKFDLSIEPRGDLRNNFLLWLVGARRRLGFDVTGGSYFLTDIADGSQWEDHLVAFRYSVLKPLGISGTPHPVSLIVPEKNRTVAREFLESAKLNGAKCVGIHPGASHEFRRLPTDKLVDIAKTLHNQGIGVVLVGAPADTTQLREAAERLPFPVPVFQKSLLDLAGLCGEIGCLVAMDSGSAHLATAVGCKTLVVFPQSYTKRSAPWSPFTSLIYPIEGENGIGGISTERFVQAISEVLNATTQR